MDLLWCTDWLSTDSSTCIMIVVVCQNQLSQSPRQGITAHVWQMNVPIACSDAAMHALPRSNNRLLKLFVATWRKYDQTVVNRYITRKLARWGQLSGTLATCMLRYQQFKYLVFAYYVRTFCPVAYLWSDLPVTLERWKFNVVCICPSCCVWPCATQRS